MTGGGAQWFGERGEQVHQLVPCHIDDGREIVLSGFVMRDVHVYSIYDMMRQRPKKVWSTVPMGRKSSQRNVMA